MKKPLFIISIMFAFSCNNPSGEISGNVSIWNGQYEVLPGAEKPTQVMVDYVIISPTWGQSFYFAIKSGAALEISAGVIFLFVSLFFSLLLWKNIIQPGFKTVTIPIILAAFAMGFIFTAPGTIKWNNQIRVEKQRYETAKDNLPAFWDQLYTEKRIVGTSGK